MISEKIKRIKEQVKPVIVTGIKMIVIGAIIVASFYQGRFIERHKNDNSKVESIFTKVNKDEVNIAIDETNNLIIIDNTTGKYTIYQDSIGQSIFKLYARNIWNKGSVEEVK